MVTDDDPAIDHPFGRFRVATEPMADGRTIHYYEWPDDRAAEAPGPPSPPEEAGDE